ncbi:MAG: LPS-assembly lipoprotein LptE [Burkholderiaceae bacterium]
MVIDMLLQRRILRTALHSGAQLIAAMMVACILTACGFQLRGSTADATIPFKTMYIGLPDNSSLGAELKRNIRSSIGTQVVRDKKEAQAILEVLDESRERLVLSLNSQGRVREYSLNYKLRFRVIDNAGKEFLPSTVVTLKRDMSFTESQLLAKESEEELLYRDMQTDLVQQLLRRLAAIKLN